MKGLNEQKVLEVYTRWESKPENKGKSKEEFLSERVQKNNVRTKTFPNLIPTPDGGYAPAATFSGEDAMLSVQEQTEVIRSLNLNNG